MPERLFEALSPWWDRLAAMLFPLLLCVAVRMVRCGVECRCTSWRQWFFEGFVALVAGLFVYFFMEAAGVPPKWCIPGVAMAGWLGPEVFKIATFYVRKKLPTGND
jgi:phosphatidylserine synthase